MTSPAPRKRQRYQVPTHLDVEDTILSYGPIGLTQRQFFLLLAGLGAGYGTWKSWGALPLPSRVVLAVLPLLVAVLLALVRPGGRTLEATLLLLLRYAVIPRVAHWQPRAPRAAEWRPRGSEWAGVPLSRRWALDPPSDPPAGRARATSGERSARGRRR